MLLACSGVGLAWSLWPLRTTAGAAAQAEPQPGDAAAATAVALEASAGPPAQRLDVAAFDAPVWRSPPKPKVEVPAVPPPPPLRLQLLAIELAGDGRPVAVLFYDQDRDTAEKVPAGGSYQGFIVMIAADQVEFRSTVEGGPRLTLIRDQTAAGGTRP